ncbi:MAG: WD40 repeat domain-containing protein [Myxococcota bacterium]|jgi:WD40 repeat protein|nr:WD40 repeat domain-containing protein [Myxococcota bacterium]
MKIEALHTLELGDGKVLGVDVQADGALVAAAGRDGVVHVVDSQSAEVVQRLKGHHEFVCALLFLPGGKLLSSGKDTSIRQWSVAKGEFESDMAGVVSGPASRTLRGQMMKSSRIGHTMTTLSLARAESGLLGSGGQDNLVKLWRSGQVLRSFDWHSRPVTRVAFRPGTDELISASRDLTIRSWNAETGAMVHRYAAHEDEIESLSWVDEQRFISGDLRGELYLWQQQSEKPLGLFATVPSAVRCSVADPSRHRLFVGLESGDLCVFDTQPRPRLAEDPEICRVEAHDFAIRCVALSADGKLLATGGNDGKLHLWRVED